MLLKFLRRAVFLAAGGFLAYLFWLPDVGSLRTTNPQTTALRELRAEEARRSGKKPVSRMIWRDLPQISGNLVHAVLLAEDDRFYQHSGFDVEQIQVALQRDWAQKRFVYGGSTITQQLARTLYLSPRKNLIRKMKEAVITVILERTLSKKRILELYLNVVEWGRGIYGAEAAARFYFGASADDLTPDEAVALASILPSPRRWSPWSEKNFMARRRTQLFERMRAAGYVPYEVLVDTASEDGDGLDAEPAGEPASEQNAEGLFITEHPAPAPPFSPDSVIPDSSAESLPPQQPAD